MMRRSQRTGLDALRRAKGCRPRCAVSGPFAMGKIQTVESFRHVYHDSRMQLQSAVKIAKPLLPIAISRQIKSIIPKSEQSVTLSCCGVQKTFEPRFEYQLAQPPVVDLRLRTTLSFNVLHAVESLQPAQTPIYCR